MACPACDLFLKRNVELNDLRPFPNTDRRSPGANPVGNVYMHAVHLTVAVTDGINTPCDIVQRP